MTRSKPLLFLLLLAIIIACTGKDESVCPDSTCDDYLTQFEAQVAFDADPECHKRLDHDDDGTACEHVFTAGGSGGAGCPTTANCGCSNKNKDVCASACCKWVVGEGCKCK